MTRTASFCATVSGGEGGGYTGGSQVPDTLVIALRDGANWTALQRGLLSDESIESAVHRLVPSDLIDQVLAWLERR